MEPVVPYAVPKEVVINRNRVPSQWEKENMSEGWLFAKSLDVVYDEIAYDKQLPLDKWSSWEGGGNPQHGMFIYTRDAYDHDKTDLDEIDVILANQLILPEEQKLTSELLLHLGTFRQPRKKSRTKQSKRKYKSGKFKKITKKHNRTK